MIYTRGVCVLALVALVSGCGGHSPSKPGSGASTAAPLTTASAFALGTARAEHEAILLPTGEIFVVGGVDSRGEVLSSTEIVSEAGVRPGPTLSMPRTGHTLTLLDDGMVLIAGGVSTLEGAPTATTEIFNPDFGDVNEGPNLAQARAYHTAFYVGDALLVAGGQGARAQIAAPTGSLTSGALTSGALTSGALSDGLLDTLERVWVQDRTSEVLPVTLSVPQRDLVGVALSPLQFVFVGGETASGPASAELFDGAGLVPLAGVPLRSGSAIAANTNSVVLLGGERQGVLLDDLEVFDGFAFQPQAPGLHPRRDGLAAVSSAGIVIAGGLDAIGPSEVVELVLPGQVAMLEPLTQARHEHTLTLGAEGVIGFVIGGYDAERAPTDSIELIQVPGLEFGSPSLSPTPSANAGAGVLEALVDAESLRDLLRAASGADCSTALSSPAAPAGVESARLPAAATARLALLIADAQAPTQAELLALPAQPKPEELIDRLEAALSALGATNARALATETRVQLNSMCAVQFPGSSLASFLNQYENKEHPAKSLLIARVRLFRGLEAAAQAPAIDTLIGKSVDADLQAFSQSKQSADETLPRVRSALQAAASAPQDARALSALAVLGPVLEFDDQGGAQGGTPTTLANPAAAPTVQAP